MIDFSCNSCGKQFRLNPEFAGRKTNCSGCKAPLEVPDSGATVAPPSPVKIAFSCDKCGMKFSVPTEFAGRKTRCPSCKAALVVPLAEQTVASVPAAGGLEGTASSLVQAGVDAGVTLAGVGAVGQSALPGALGGKSGGGTRYIIEKELARGGMGAVLRAVDCDIRREVAVKYLLNQADTKNKIRFVEEAQITGQLEHPNIVPIHELGVDSQKRIFFAMKMVKGRSLAQILKALAMEPATAEKEFGLSRLLTIFVSICNALAYAHSRGVVHRDLKPANIMVGDFGEVYVMDWGLAKVLHQGVGPEVGPPMAMPVARLASATEIEPALPVAAFVEAPTSAGTSGKIQTSRDADADLTQAGAVLGTPVYMPPEQAAGRIDEIDQRSDIYSLGAVLYEIVTLHPPIDRAGGFWAIVMRVGQGQIVPPETKAPARARAGKIPPELAAIAMKALAKEKTDRYPTADALRTDIELFLEGRSVSAKQDSNWEVAKKFVKRNKGLSTGVAAAAMVLLVSMVFLFSAWRETSRTFAAYESEQREKEKRTRRAVPAFLKAARQAVEHKEIDDAVAQVSVALDYEPNNVEALLLKSQLLIARREFSTAAKTLAAYLRLRPDDAAARQLAELCAEDTSNPNVQAELAQVLIAQNQLLLAMGLLSEGPKHLDLYRKKLAAAWPAGGYLLDYADHRFEFSMDGGSDPKRFPDLEPLRGLPISKVHLVKLNVIDLSPLRDIPLDSLTLIDMRFLKDLSPLKKSRLTRLYIQTCQEIQDLSGLQGLPLKELAILRCSRVKDLTPLRSLSLRKIEVGNSGDYGVMMNIEDLSPLKGQPIEWLACYRSKVRSIEPLRGMPTKKLVVMGNPLADLGPVRGMPLQELDISNTLIDDLSPLEGMALTRLDCSGSRVHDLGPLRNMPLTYLKFADTKVKHLEPLRGMPLIELQTSDDVLDLTPLQGMKLEFIAIPRNPSLKGMDVLRSMTSLRRIQAGRWHVSLDAAEFWQKWDKGEIK